MATGTLCPTPFQTVLDANGNPVDGALITTYLAGTTTLAATYTEVTLTIANTNPIEADSSGRFVAFLAPGVSYKFVYTTSASVAIRTQDYIAAVPPSSTNLDVTGIAGEALSPAGAVVYLSDGSGGKTAGSWYEANSANAYSSTFPQVGMVPFPIASGDTGAIRMAGIVTGIGSLITGTTYYVSATSGELTATAPANARVVGVADSTSSIVLFPALPTSDTGAWTSYTPTWSNTGTPNTLGNGTLTGKYRQVGKTCHYRVALTFGTTTVPGSLSWTFTLPLTASDVNLPGSSGYIIDQSAGLYGVAVAINTTTTALPINTDALSTGLTTTVPMAWVSTDYLTFGGSYEVA